MKLSGSPLTGKLSGSAGSTTASGNTWGRHLSNKRKQSKERTIKRSFIRICFQITSIIWQNLTPTQRNEWDDYGHTIVKTNRVGNSYHLTGFAAFKMIAMVQLTRGKPVAPDPPTGAAPAPFLDATWVVDPLFPGPPQMTVTVTPDVPAGAVVACFFVFHPFSHGRQAFPGSGDGVMINFDLSAGVTTFDLLTGYNAAYGVTQPNRTYFCLVETISAEGVRSLPAFLAPART